MQDVWNRLKLLKNIKGNGNKVIGKVSASSNSVMVHSTKDKQKMVNTMDGEE